MSNHKSYKFSILVGVDDIDQFNHVNNEIYITWMMSAAVKHSEKLGYSLQKYVSDGAAFFVRRHEIDYYAPVLLGEELELETWVTDMGGVKSTRHYCITRQSDKKIVLEAKTLWVYVNLISGRPTPIPLELVDAFRKK